MAEPGKLTLAELAAAITPGNRHAEGDFGQAEGAERSEREVWLHQNEGAIASYATFVDEHGVFSDGMCCF